MKKILFVLQTMVCGGVENELITLLRRFDRQKYELTLLLLYVSDAEVLERVPSDVRIINFDIDKKYYCSGLMDTVKSMIQRHKVRSVLALLFRRVFGGVPVPASLDLNDLPKLSEFYDVAVCYHMHSPVSLRYVAERVTSHKKYAWIHNDFITSGYRVEKYDEWLRKYDLFIGVSQRLCDEFIRKCPLFEKQIIVLHNIVDEQEIRLKSSDFSLIDSVFCSDKRFKILTVGRFVEQKGFDLAIRTCKLLKDRRMDISWYAIGYGKEMAKMEEMINEYELNSTFIILGRKDNPYPYMKLADLYVQPSRHEGYPLTLIEASSLGTYIIATDFAGASEMLVNGVTGTVVVGFDPNSLANAIQDYIEKPITAEAASTENNWERIEALFK